MSTSVKITRRSRNLGLGWTSDTKPVAEGTFREMDTRYWQMSRDRMNGIRLFVEGKPVDVASVDIAMIFATVLEWGSFDVAVLS